MSSSNVAIKKVDRQHAAKNVRSALRNASLPMLSACLHIWKSPSAHQEMDLLILPWSSIRERAIKDQDELA